MSGREHDPRELHAAAAIAERLAGTADSRDGVSAPPGTHDFDIYLPDGRVVALEVTSIADRDVVAFHNLMGDTVFLAPRLKADWWIRVPDPEAGQPAIRVKRAKPTILAALELLEAQAVSELEQDVLDPWARLPGSTPRAVHEAIEKLRSVEVTSVRSTGQRPGGLARLLFSAHGSASGNPDQLNELVISCVKADLHKLKAARDRNGAAVSERHLFIWLTDSYPDAELAFSTMPPPAPPAIPPVIDVVWLATFAWPIRLWCLRPPGPWEVVGS